MTPLIYTNTFYDNAITLLRAYTVGRQIVSVCSGPLFYICMSLILLRYGRKHSRGRNTLVQVVTSSTVYIEL